MREFLVRVFVSSTYLDLVEHRKALFEALARIELDVACMEVFGARPEQPVDACLREVDKADLFIGVYAHRYGHVPRGEELSITEIELRHAESQGKPILCFVVDDEHPWSPRFMDRNGAADKLQALKQYVADKWVRETFTTPPDLASKVLPAVMRLTKTEDRATEAASLEPVPPDIKLLLDGRPERLPLRVEPATLVYAYAPQPPSSSLLPDVGTVEEWEVRGHALWPTGSTDSYLGGYRCELTNYSNVPLINIRLSLTLTYRSVAAPGDPNPDETIVRSAVLALPRIEANHQTMTVYFYNLYALQHVVFISISDTATAEVPGEATPCHFRLSRTDWTNTIAVSPPVQMRNAHD